MRHKGDVVKQPRFVMVHARSVNADGKVVPRCGYMNRSDRQLNVVVTGDERRVGCETCKGLRQ